MSGLQQRSWLGSIAKFGLGILLVACISATDFDRVSGQEKKKEETQVGEIPWYEIPLLEREPYDVIKLDEESNSVELRVQPLPFDNREVPTDRPSAERLQFVLVDEPGKRWEVAWRNIVEIRLFERVILFEAQNLSDAGNYDEAYRYFNYLLVNYPTVPGISDSYNEFLYRDSTSLLESAEYKLALSGFEELIRRDATFKPTGTQPIPDEQVSKILDVMLGENLQDKDYRLAKMTIARIKAKYPAAQAMVVNKYEDAIRADAEAHRDQALRYFEQGEGRKAHGSIRQMLNVLPEIEGGIELANRVMEKYPLVLVGVNQKAENFDRESLDSWAARRAGMMIYRALVEFRGQGQDGGQYRFPNGRIEYGEDGRSFTFEVTRTEGEAGLPAIDAYDVARRLLDVANESSPEYFAAWRRLLKSVSIEEGNRIHVELSQAFVLPEALLQVSHQPKPLLKDSIPPNGLYAPVRSSNEEQSYKINAAYDQYDLGNRPEIVEIPFERSEDAVDAIIKGDIDVIDRVFPSELSRLNNTPGIAVDQYQIPIVHMLVPNPRSEHMANPTFRLALLMGIDREGILGNGLLGGIERQGFEVLTGPFPVGVNDSDPLGYAYNFKVDPISFDWRLATGMVVVAENQIKAMLETQELELPPRPKLVLAHAADDFSRIACQRIAEGWKMIQVDCELRELAPGEVRPPDDDYDLLYTQICIEEPLIDAHRIFGRGGIVPTENSSVDGALRQLEVAQSWADARRRLNEIHMFVHNEVIVLPLYQTVEHYAYRTDVRGVGRRLITLYDNVGDWTIVAGGDDVLAEK